MLVFRKFCSTIFLTLGHYFTNSSTLNSSSYFGCWEIWQFKSYFLTFYSPPWVRKTRKACASLIHGPTTHVVGLSYFKRVRRSSCSVQKFTTYLWTAKTQPSFTFGTCQAAWMKDPALPFSKLSPQIHCWLQSCTIPSSERFHLQHFFHFLPFTLHVELWLINSDLGHSCTFFDVNILDNQYAWNAAWH